MITRLLLAATLCLPAGVTAAPVRFEGAAHAVTDGRLLYREVHWQASPRDGDERLVLYLCPGGQPFARKWMPASTIAQVRGYRLEDRRSGQAATVDVSDGAVAIRWQEATAEPPRQRQLALEPQAVVDAGFDAAVRRHWPAMMRGEPVRLAFLMPGRQRWVPVRVQRLGGVSWQGVPAQSIRVSVDAWYGFAAPTLALVYADADRRLLEFRGTSNLRDEGGRYPEVRVSFRDAAVPGDPAQWRRDQQRPLVARCDAGIADGSVTSGDASAASDRRTGP